MMRSSLRSALVYCFVLSTVLGCEKQATAQALPTSATQVQTSPNPVNSAAADFAQLARYHAGDEALLRDGNPQARVVFLGDSILERWGRDAGVWFGNRGWMNRGIGGQTTSQMLLRERNDVLALQPRAVVLEGGSNDMRLGFSPEAIRDNFATMGELAEAHHLRVFVATMTPVCDCVRPLTGFRTVEHIAQLNNMLKELCRERNWNLINLNPALADSRGLMRAEFTSDGVHPNDEGYKLLGEIVLRALRQFR